ncbi:hypothetical protein HKD24_11095 [Gluconobacter sp. LMG 31484]|uniref:Uncharacterized protein n=1 Tax=Gluconobacter vitians TaxID=2728102 RepID=A0ABR9Y742_9PROT|nr:hypothetical protein [Gluconobacter vitians]MBF0859759.1 hypothetical protein [Gluconobacter vitians]
MPILPDLDISGISLPLNNNKEKVILLIKNDTSKRFPNDRIRTSQDLLVANPGPYRHKVFKLLQVMPELLSNEFQSSGACRPAAGNGALT